MRTSELLDWLQGALPLWEEAALSDAPLDPKSVDLLKEYGKLNRKLFDGKLGIYPMKWNRRKGSGALVKWRRVGGEMKIVPPGRGRRTWSRGAVGGTIKILSVEVSTFYQSTIIGFYARLAHEMIHVFLLEQNIDDGHGKMFKSEMRRINAMNTGFKVDVREDARDFVPDVVAKTGHGQRRGVLIFDGHSILVFGPKHFPDTLFELIGFPQSFLEKHKFEWWWSDAPFLMKYPAARKIGRRFGSYKVTSDEIKEIKQGEKIAKMKDGQPKTLMPKYFDGATITRMERIGNLGIRLR